MDEKARKRIIYVIFIGAIAFGVINLSGRKSTIAPSDSTGNLPPALAATAVQPTASADSIPEAEWGRDPFVQRRNQQAGRLEDASTENGALRLTAVSESGGRMLAVINGHVVGEGESVAGWRVINLTATQALIEGNGRQVTLTIGD